MDLMLDSGAYSAWSSGTSIKVEDYASFIKENEKHIDICINLDVIGDAKQSWENQKILEQMGLNPLPVFHQEDDIEYLHKCMEYEYFCIGGVAKASRHRRHHFFEKCWTIICDTPDRKPKHKVHGLGIAAIEFIQRYPWYSIDSSSWVMYGRYGAILIPKKRNGNYDFTKNPHIIWVSGRSPKMSEIDGNHFTTLTNIEQEHITKYISQHGFSIEELAEEGRSRDDLNLRFFLEMEKQTPEWPWPFYKSSQFRLI